MELGSCCKLLEKLVYAKKAPHSNVITELGQWVWGVAWKECI